jgi:membrane protease YdiL (CAAX protease family)
MHAALSWFIGGLIVFIPLFILAIVFTRRDGYQSNSAVYKRLRLKKLIKRDWLYVAGSSIIIFMFTGLIMGISQFLHARFGIPLIDTNPSFMKFEPFEGSERFLLLVWLVMFFFNIYGEELLWRGYILPGQEKHFAKKAWLVNALFWVFFHIPFGIGLMILLLPIMFILPWAVQKTGNTNVGILIHTILNGPMFILVSLGVIK